MRATSYYVIGFCMLFLAIHVYYDKAEEPLSPENLLKNMSINDVLFNVTDKFAYTNLYEEKPTTNNVIFNIIHGVVYYLVVIVNTLFPISVYLASLELSSTLIKIGFALIALIVITNLFIILKSIIILVFFIREKRKNHEKVWH